MKLTGKCKADFEGWIKGRKYSILHDVGERQMNVVPLGDMIDQLDSSMKYGVFEDFFDSVGVFVEITNDCKPIKTFWVDINGESVDDDFKLNNRIEARALAIKKANEIYNERKSK